MNSKYKVQMLPYNVGFTYALSNTIGGRSNGTSDVGTVTQGVGVGTTDSVVAERSTATEVPVVDVNAAVNDVTVSTGAGSGVVGVGAATGGSAGDGGKTPRSTALSSQSTVRQLLSLKVEVDSVVRLDESNLGALLDLINGSLVELARVGVPGADVELLLNTRGVTLVQATTVDIADPVQVSLNLGLRSLGLESNDVLVRSGSEFLSLLSGSGEDCREQSSKVESKTAEAGHFDD
jgi:hypothetical protein